MYKVGLVEDEEALNKLIKNYLEKEDFIDVKYGVIDVQKCIVSGKEIQL